jgi:two-component system, OmpR family, phosphate regulon sensor histidine kinase PhoR
MGGCLSRAPNAAPTSVTAYPPSVDAATEDIARLADQLRLGMLRVTPDRVIAQANEAAHVLLGKRTGTIAGRSIMETFLDHRAEEAIIGAASGQSGGAEVDGPEGRRLVIRARADRSRPGHIWVLIEDVTELRRLQRIRTEFIDNLSHELRTPLTTIRLLTERLTDELATLDVPDRVRDRVATIDVETGHLVQMVNELLDLSRIEQAATQLHLDDVAIGPLLTASAARLRTFAERQLVDIEIQLPDVPLPPVWGDADRLGQLLLNLLHNAIKFSRSGGRVTLAAERQQSEVVVSVADTGVGIPVSDQPRIFERFFKVDRARERGQGGTGLGLAIARHIADGHRGRIWFQSEDGRGSTFFVALPVAGVESGGAAG